MEFYAEVFGGELGFNLRASDGPMVHPDTADKDGITKTTPPHPPLLGGEDGGCSVNQARKRQPH
ncbi:hypothetical protein [Rothia nasimurium]|uniref:hypothetical protein n=1 Tax=Rothia nasimurium TaxID=85336 RepID=UPI002DD6679B|nr:hypothetical protein [Rothia nasimurium]